MSLISKSFGKKFHAGCVLLGNVPIWLCLILITWNCRTHSHPPLPSKGECVILLHGLLHSHKSMRKIEKELIRHGYDVVNVQYPSKKHRIEFLAEEILAKILDRRGEKPQTKLHFVTHSVGGIVIRYYLKHHKPENLGRVVMISPPNQGSELVDRFKNFFLFRLIAGPAGRQVGIDENSLPQSLGPVDFELGVIAGFMSINLVYSLMIPGPDDGVVSVKRTRIQGMTDFIVAPCSHSAILGNSYVIDQIIHFLEKGEFRQSES